MSYGPLLNKCWLRGIREEIQIQGRVGTLIILSKIILGSLLKRNDADSV